MVQPPADDEQAGLRGLGRRQALREEVPSYTKPKEEWIAVPVPDSGISREMVEAAREAIKDNHRPSSAGHRSWELSGGVGRCVACGRVLTSRKRGKNKGGRRYQYFYYRCSAIRQARLQGMP